MEFLSIANSSISVTDIDARVARPVPVLTNLIAQIVMANYSAATNHEQTASDEGEYAHDHGRGHAAPQGEAVWALVVCHVIKVMHGVPKVQCCEQNGNST
jgi:hypothetical protein